MTDLRFEVGFTEHPKLKGLELLALGLHVRAIDYAATNLTDGFVPTDELASLTGSVYIRPDSPRTLPGIGETITPGELARALTTAGVWHDTDGGYLIHDFADYQITKSKLFTAFDTITRRRARDAERKATRSRAPDEHFRGKVSAESVSLLHARDPKGLDLGVGSSSVSVRTSNPTVLPAGELGISLSDAGLLGEIARSLRDSQGHRTLAVLASVSESLSDQAIRDEYEALQRRRANATRGPIRSECAWLVDRLKKRRDREAARDLASAELLREIA